MTEQELKTKYSKVVGEFLNDYVEAPARAFGRNQLTGEYNQNKKNVLDNFKANNAMFKAIAATSGIELKLLDTSGMNPPDGDEIDLEWALCSFFNVRSLVMTTKLVY